VPFVITPRGQLQIEALQRRRFKKTLFHRLAARRVLSSAAAIHFTSELERERSRGATGGQRTFVVGNGFDFDSEAEPRDTRQRDLSQCRLGIVGFIDARKGFDILLPALARAPGDIHLHIVGPDVSGGRKLVERLINEYDLGDRVRFRGFLQGRALADAYRSFDYLVVPSMSESFGNTVIEALGFGVPVIVNPNVPLADLVETEKLGLVVENTVDAWSAILEEVQQRPIVWDAERLSSVVRDRFGYRAMGEKLKQALAAVLND
jgi:glycosyltransferase involved in cell wall biosynthesis